MIYNYKYLSKIRENKAFKGVITSSSFNSGKGLFYSNSIGNGRLYNQRLWHYYKNIEESLISEDNFFKGQYKNICDYYCEKFIKTSLPSYPWSSIPDKYPTYYNNIGYRVIDDMNMRKDLNIGEHMFLTVATKPGLKSLNYVDTNRFRSLLLGSSFASPIVASIVGLMLEANPDLTYRDIKHILISTAKPLSKPVKIENISESNIQLLQNSTTNFRYTIGYKDTITNQAEYSFHIFDGFGQPDVDAAVNMARDYHENITTQYKFPDGGNSQGDYDKIKVIFKQKSCLDFFCKYSKTNNDLIKSYNISSNMTIEHISLGIKGSIKSHKRLQSYIQSNIICTSSYAIDLISPRGHKSILHTPFTTVNELQDVRLYTNRFYGEGTKGNWKIRVVNLNPDKCKLDIKGDLELNFYGHYKGQERQNDIVDEVNTKWEQTKEEDKAIIDRLNFNRQ